MTLPDFLSPSPRVAPRLRYVVDLPAGAHARALIEMAKCVLRDAARRATPGAALHTALTLLASGRVEEVQP